MTDMGSASLFDEAIANQLRQFPDNYLCKRLEDGVFTMADYHAYLTVVFHQVYHSAGSFAVAAAHSTPKHQVIRDYLFKHAGEEFTHWQWVLDDLKATGGYPEKAKSRLPTAATEAYVAYNFWVAQRSPYGRLGIAAFLEGMSGLMAEQYIQKIIKQVGLKKEQMSFMRSHGELDKGHAAEIREILVSANLSNDEWKVAAHCAQVGGALFRSLLNSASEIA